MNKSNYVRRQGQTRKHSCHWPGCAEQVPPAMWGCRAHWLALPQKIRSRIWATFVPGQEVRGTPTQEYLEAAATAQRWIEEHS